MALGFKVMMIKFWILVLVTYLIGISSAQLSDIYYAQSCPQALVTIQGAVQSAIMGDNRIGASLLRLHFTDCFVQGCDASILLDDTDNFIGEKSSSQNANSLKGFEVIDNIKSQLESICPNVVSCADILTVAARDAVVYYGGESWNLLLGRRDSTTASLTLSNSDLPSPTSNVDDLILSFANKGFSAQEMVTLSGAHTLGEARCTTFKERIYNEVNIDSEFCTTKRLLCPIGGDDNNCSPLDSTPLSFDNAYYNNLEAQQGLLHSDQQLFCDGSSTNAQVKAYTTNIQAFKNDFAKAMFKMSLLSPLTGTDGQIRHSCRIVN